MNDNQRQFGWGLPILVSLAFWAVIIGTGLVFAQQPNPVTVQGKPDVNMIACTPAATQKIAVAGTAQDLFPASPVIHGFIMQNVDTTEPLCLTFDGTDPVCGQPGTFVMQAGATTTFAGAGSFSAPLGMGMNAAPRIKAATINHPYACVKW